MGTTDKESHTSKDKEKEPIERNIKLSYLKKKKKDD